MRARIVANAGRIDAIRRPHGGIAARIAIQSQPRRVDMTSINTRASVRFAACATLPMPPRGIVRSCIAQLPAQDRRTGAAHPIRRHRLAPHAGPQTNDRFKRRAGYFGTAVSSKMRSGRRWWPGQYALPYIR
ncbi:hypothetical protein [Burkholderia metallica]